MPPLYAPLSLVADRARFNFFWPITSLFAILRVDLWILGRHTYSNGYMAILHVMCDMSPFVVAIPVPDESSATLAPCFMQHGLMKFCLCHLVALDDGTPSKDLSLSCAKL